MQLRNDPKGSTKFQVIDPSAPWAGDSMLIYGPPGAGKTYLACTALEVEELRDVLLLCADNGSRTVRNKKKFQGLSIISTLDCSTSDYHEIFRWLSEDSRTKVSTTKTFEAAGLGSPRRFKTIIVDNLGAIHWATIQEILRDVHRNRVDPETPNQADYGLARARMLNLMRELAKFSAMFEVMFIFTSHLEIMKTEYETIAKMRPAIPGKLGYEIPGDLPIVGYLEVSTGRAQLGQKPAAKGGSRIIHFDASSSSKAEVKDQSEALGISITNPTMAKIYGALNG